jgi:hypothetical protein
MSARLDHWQASTSLGHAHQLAFVLARLLCKFGFQACLILLRRKKISSVLIH